MHDSSIRSGAEGDPGGGITAREVTVTYRNGHTALRDASFEIPKGTVTALVGVNGSGKSTLFKAIMDLGFIVKPNLEKVHALRPDLILITSLQAEHYTEMSRIAPVIHFDVDYRDSSADHIAIVRAHFLTLAKIFGKEDVAQEVLAGFDAKLAEVLAATRDRPERALIILYNNGAFSALGTRSRYGFVFDAFGMKPANEAGDTGLHGQPVTSEFIQATNPDIIFVIDRTVVMERRPVLDAATIENPLLRETNAWKDGKLIFVDPEAWYVTAASITPLEILMDEVIAAYRD
ncbi:ABC transporter substrate-binding protein [Paenirhodobacter sp.]|uniref:siderophore ABC transporter substrate-binding protein n=1 Tax=Paenirhodobacter sp. TaxID=1965326 RepID=UPI003B3E82C1